MALAIVGAGFGRTGTNSLKVALEMLGFGPCHHMLEVLGDPDQLPFWQAAARGEIPDWDTVFANFGSAVDWPSARYWREIAAYYPDAKVLLSIRPEDKWIDSVHATIHASMMDRVNQSPSLRRDRGDMAYETICRQVFDGKLGDRDAAKAVYRTHIAEVQATIPAARLLTFDVVEGWEPLCRFLGVAVPDAPFPRTNSTEQFQARVREAANAAR
jgi:hypothetical protein